jgi:endonuclease-8
VPEGDTVWRAARDLHAALAGKELTRCDIRVPRFATVDFTGDTVEEVVSRGKHLLIRGGGGSGNGKGNGTGTGEGWDIHSHLKMEGLWP